MLPRVAVWVVGSRNKLKVWQESFLLQELRSADVEGY
jgi:hypothetical protein